MTFEQAMIHTLTKENDKLQVEIGRLRQLLERQSCEDCVSRQAVLGLMQLKMGGKKLYKAVYDLPSVTPKIPTSNDCVSRADLLAQINESWETIETKLDFVNIVKVLPPVIPTRKQGEWDEGYGFPYGAYWKCSCCNELIKVRYPMNFCPNCGTDMRGDLNGSN